MARQESTKNLSSFSSVSSFPLSLNKFQKASAINWEPQFANSSTSVEGKTSQPCWSVRSDSSSMLFDCAHAIESDYLDYEYDNSLLSIKDFKDSSISVKDYTQSIVDPLDKCRASVASTFSTFNDQVRDDESSNASNQGQPCTLGFGKVQRIVEKILHRRQRSPLSPKAVMEPSLLDSIYTRSSSDRQVFASCFGEEQGAHSFEKKTGEGKQQSTTIYTAWLFPFTQWDPSVENSPSTQ
jgi:hypothetical protein